MGVRPRKMELGGRSITLWDSTVLLCPGGGAVCAHPQQPSPQLSLCPPPILVRRGRFSPREASRPTILIPPETSSGLVAALFPQSDDELVVETFFLRAALKMYQNLFHFLAPPRTASAH